MRLLLLLLIFLPRFVSAATVYRADVIERQPQDETLFTQGLEFRDGVFFQSSGLYGKSYVLRFTPSSEAKPRRLDVPANVFAEGITVLNNDLFLVSWKEETAWRFDATTFALEKTFYYSGEGWGLTHNGNELILSDGSDVLKFIDPNNFGIIRSINVSFNNKKVSSLNELEYANGIIWANQWQTNNIYGIDPSNGDVVATLDVSELQKEAAASAIDSVTNGIAYDRERDLYWLTGKYWRYRYLVKLQPQN